MRDLMERDWRSLDIDQDLGLGMMLWLAHFFPDEPWAEAQTRRSLRTLETMWVDPPGYFSRAPWLRDTKFAFTNYGVSLGLQAAGIWPGRVDRLNAFFEDWRSGDEYDREAITWVMACTSHLPGAFLTRGGERTIESDQARERSSAGAVVDGSASKSKSKERG
ncbi:hypothetical protein [Mesorhizobium sp. M0814]|uniref:hypothetical protein n=1 Tax=unclassified Mesorhizobium TaxID=325217 RepID=UPI00333A30F0